MRTTNPQLAHVNKHGKGSRCLRLLGRTFGNLRVIWDCGINIHGSTVWLCVCNCGKTTLVRGCRLTKGHITGCGCRRKLGHGESNFNALFDSYKRQAKKRGVGFWLTRDKFAWLTKQECFYCGQEPAQTVLKSRSFGAYIYNGVDRLDSKLDYTEENCVPCCGVCNIMKNDTPAENFLQHVKKIYNRSVASVI